MDTEKTDTEHPASDAPTQRTGAQSRMEASAEAGTSSSGSRRPVAEKGHPLGLSKGTGEGLGSGEREGIGHVDTLPRILRKVEPRYPVGAREGGLAGSVKVRFLVDARGRVRDTHVVQADPAGVFEESALAAVRKWRFKPARRDGRSVPTYVVLPIRFSLQ